MSTKTWRDKLDGIGGLDYITFLNVPMRESEFGPVIDYPMEKLEKMAAIAIISEGIPLRGKEVLFLRKVLGLSREKFAAKLDLTSGAIVKWEQSKDERLHLVNEITVRIFIAEQLELNTPFKFSDFLGLKPHKLELKAA